MRVTAKAIAIAIVFLCQLSAFSQQVAKTIPYSGSPEGLIGFLEFRPTDYGSQKHPLIIFLHGIGERGNGTTDINRVTTNAIPKFCAAGATMRFTVGGVTSSFVVLSPQLSTQLGYWPVYYVKQMIAYAKANLQIDPNRIYITGLSLGGGGTWRVITNTDNFDNSFDAGIAAAAPVCGTQEETDADVCNTIAYNHLPIWAFHSMDDGTVGVGATQHAQILLNNCGTVTPTPKFTYYQSGGHAGAWINAYDTGHITTTINVNGVLQSFTANPNLYEWFLSNSRSGSSSTTNTAPAVSAGTGQTITLPTSSATLNGSASGTNGATISSYSWVKTSGPSAGTISTPGAATTTVTGLTQGTYVFTLTATDNHGLTTSSSVTITVNSASNISPIANAGSNITITLPTNSATLNGSASSDPDGSIVSYAWTMSSGPNTPSVANASAATTSISGLVAGTYYFTLTVTDNAGAKSSANVTVTVKSSTNTSPVANAGSNITITLPTNSVTLTGSASSDPDGSIASYAWTMPSGPNIPSIANASAVTTNVSGLVAGIYYFTLTVTDNAGAKSAANVMVTVIGSGNISPVSNAGSNTTITLPTNSVTLNGTSSSDQDGSIVSYAWTMPSGPNTPSIANPSAATTTVSGLIAGPYYFTLTVTDNAGAKSTANVTITVKGASSSGNLLGYLKMAGSSDLACADASSSGRTAVYGTSLANGSYLYTDAAMTQVVNGGWNWYSITTTLGGPVNQSMAIYPNGAVFNLGTCKSSSTSSSSTTSSATTSNLLGYVKMAGSANLACADASSSGRTAVYGTSIANGSYLYTDAAMTQVLNGGWNWYSFTPTLGGAVTQSFAVYPIGSIFYLGACSSSYRTMTTEEDQRTATTASSAVISDVTTPTGKLSIFPNPVQTNATITLSSVDNGVKTISLFNSSGVLAAKYTWQTVKGNNTFQLSNVSGLTNGLYIVDVRDNTGKPIGFLKFLKSK